MRFILVKDDLGNSVILDTVYDMVVGTIRNQEMAELLVAGMNLNIKMPIYHWQTCQTALLYTQLINYRHKGNVRTRKQLYTLHQFTDRFHNSNRDCNMISLQTITTPITRHFKSIRLTMASLLLICLTTGCASVTTTNNEWLMGHSVNDGSLKEPCIKCGEDWIFIPNEPFAAQRQLERAGGWNNFSY